jgi:hypothetical protein
MKNDIDSLIQLMDMLSQTQQKDEMGEQDSAPASGGGASDGGGDKPEYPTVTKWESGASRGPANQIGLTKWSDIVKITRGKANTLL